MKCIHCGTDHNHKQRVASGGRCLRCKHRFAFEPHDDPHHVTDTQFQAAVKRVSGDGTLHFTDRQLWYELAPRTPRPPWWRGSYGWFPVLGGGGAAALGALGIVAVPPLALAMIGAVSGAALGAALNAGSTNRVDRPAPEVPFETFRKSYLERWTEVHGPLPQLVVEPGADASPREVPPDVAAFSFDRAVVTQHAGIAAMLVANRFHFEHNCAVLSLDGYPRGIAGTVREMLRKNPRLTVFTLHDASAEGAALPFALREPEWFPEPTTLIVDAGLRTGSGLPVLPGPPVELPPPVRKELQLASPEWFEAGNRAELAAVRPAEIMRMLYRAFAATGLPGEPAYDDAVSRAGGGMIWAGYLPVYHGSGSDGSGGGGGGDTAATDGFG